VPTAPDDAEIELIRRSGVALRVGRLSLSAGTGAYRVKASMARVAHALGVEHHHAHVTLTEITTTSHRGSSFRTEVAEVRSVGIDANRLCALERFAQDVERRAPVTVEDATRELDRIQAARPLYPTALNALWAAVACAAFAFLNNGGVVEVVGVFLGAGAGQALRRTLVHRGGNQLGVTMLAAALATLVYVLFLAAFGALGGAATSHEAGHVSAVLFLVPGFPLVTGALDLARLDFSAGVARLTYALTILTSAALALWAVSMLVGLVPEPEAPPVLQPGVLVSLRLLASFLGVLGFALMFNSPWTMALAAAAIGMVANVVRLWMVDAEVPVQAAAAAAALLVGLLAAVVAPRMNVPRVTVSVPAVVIMVPGATAYRAIYDLSVGETVQAVAYAVEAALVVASLAIGLAVARMLTDREWSLER
jgi:uncharacterized membrane protein YjjP (DUF1212 family)